MPGDFVDTPQLIQEPPALKPSSSGTSLKTLRTPNAPEKPYENFIFLCTPPVSSINLQ